MAEMVTSAVAGETVNRIISSIISKDDDKSTENMERLEMAHVKMANGKSPMSHCYGGGAS
jgi:hypothetical protein